MISSISNNLKQVTSELVAAKQAAKTTTDSDGKEKVDNSLFDVELAPKTDTLEISPEGLAAASAQTSTDTGSSGTTDASTSSDAGAVAPPPPMAKPAAMDETESTDSSTTKDLSSYSADELDELVDAGTITETEKNVELARREMEESMEKNQDTPLAAPPESKDAKPTKPELEEARDSNEKPPVGDDLALTEGAATEDGE